MSLRVGVREARSQLTGSGINETPAVVRASLTLSQDRDRAAALSLTSASWDIEPGNVFSLYDPEFETEAYVVYVEEVGQDNVATVITGYGGSPTPSDDLTADTLWEVSPPDGWTSWTLFNKVKTVLNRHLWPSVWKWGTRKITSPDPTIFQTPIPAHIRSVDAAYQEDTLGNVFPVEVLMRRNIDPSVSDTGSLLWHGGLPYPHYPLVFTTREEFTADDLGEVDGLADLVGSGAAALAIDAGVVARSLAPESDMNRLPQDKARVLWRTFITQRDQWTSDLRQDIVNRVRLI